MPVLARRAGRWPSRPTTRPNQLHHGQRLLPSCPTGGRGARRAPSTSTRTATRSGSPSAAVRTQAARASIARRGKMSDLTDGAQVRLHRQAREELRRGPADLPARHLRRSRRQRLGDRRPGRRAAAGARRAADAVRRERQADARRRRPADRAARRARRTAIRCSSSARTARCC